MCVQSPLDLCRVLWLVFLSELLSVDLRPVFLSGNVQKDPAAGRLHTLRTTSVPGS